LVAAAAVLLGTLVATASAQPAAAPPGLIIGVGNFSHIVSDIERSIQFYRDVIGLESGGPTRTFSGEAAMRASNTPGAHSLFATLKVPGSPLGVEIIEYKDVDRKPVTPRFQDPGAATLILTVRDVDAIVARAKAAGVHINSADGVPATIPGGNRVVFLQDPDGFFVELFQPAQVPSTSAPPSSNVVNSGFEIMVADTDRTMRVYKEILGFSPQVGTTFDGTKLLMDTAGTPGAQFKRSAATIPGSSVTMAFLEFKHIERRPLRTRLQDPGTPILQLRVHDIDSATKAWKASGGEIISTGGEPADIGGGLKIVVLRDPNNLMLELIQAAPPR
jgi:catechol 2,3-dioxygenase-like lactoylglutathione lyase family enzyme